MTDAQGKSWIIKGITPTHVFMESTCGQIRDTWSIDALIKRGLQAGTPVTVTLPISAP